MTVKGQGMSSFELNKIAAAVLLSGVVAMGAGILSRHLVEEDELEQNVYVVDIPEATEGGTPGDGKGKALEPISGMLALADLNKGQQLFKKCGACHTPNKDGKHGTGPNLWSVVGNKKASKTGYAYSSAMLAAGGNWDYEALNAYLDNPKAFIPKNKMTFVGLKKPEERAAVIAYLHSLSDAPAPLPPASAPAAVKDPVEAAVAAPAPAPVASEKS